MAGVSEDNAQGWKIVQKMNCNFEDKLSAEGIILRYTSKQETGLVIL